MATSNPQTSRNPVPETRLPKHPVRCRRPQDVHGVPRVLRRAPLRAVGLASQGQEQHGHEQLDGPALGLGALSTQEDARRYLR